MHSGSVKKKVQICWNPCLSSVPSRRRWWNFVNVLTRTQFRWGFTVQASNQVNSGNSLKDRLTQCKCGADDLRAVHTPRMTSYESKTKQRSAPRNKGSDSGTLIGTLTSIVPPAGCLCFPLWSQACPQLIPWVNSPADIHSSSQVFTSARLFLLICFSSQTDWRAGPGGPASGREAAEGENILTRNPKAPSDRLYQTWTSFYTDQMWSSTCFSS